MLPLTTAAYLTMFPVQSLERLKVFQKDPIWQVSILHLNVHKDWQRPRSICTGCSNRETLLRRELYNRNLPVFKRRCLPRNCWYCCSWAEISHSAVACCGPIPPGVPLPIPWFFCDDFILLDEAANIHRVRNDLYCEGKSVSGPSNASSLLIGYFRIRHTCVLFSSAATICLVYRYKWKETCFSGRKAAASLPCAVVHPSVEAMGSLTWS